ncbi:MAG: hypothetical protein GY822_29655 [Deltaproteobacteria bacterium]|nr:hypothetical protein [Deltaproteobacteria bacterium]
MPVLPSALCLSLDTELLSNLEPPLLAPPPLWRELLGRADQKKMIAVHAIFTHLAFGECAPALVVDTEPLLVAVFSEKLDAVVVLRFDDEVLCAKEIEVGARLLGIIQHDSDIAAADLLESTMLNRNTGWTNFKPLIADFLSRDVLLIAKSVLELPSSSWTRCEELSQDFMNKGAIPRDGRPSFSGISRGQK